MIDLYSMTEAELSAFLGELGEPRFRAKQIRSWLAVGVPISEMSKQLPVLNSQIVV